MNEWDLTDAPTYEPPAVTDVGDFVDLTKGTVFAGNADDASGASKFYAG